MIVIFWDENIHEVIKNTGLKFNLAHLLQDNCDPKNKNEQIKQNTKSGRKYKAMKNQRKFFKEQITNTVKYFKEVK
jgi:hypothetical protein